MNIVSTYRLQFHQSFTFKDAAAIVPYLHQLGITHVYASPYLKAVAGSTHGYDVIDHSQLNPEIGTEEDFRLFVRALSQHDMSHILDTVPNHMGVETNNNRWWNDVLENGQQSRFADYFDIDWTNLSSRPEMVGKVLLPVLGEPYGQALSRQSLKLVADGGQEFACYYDRRFPIRGRSTDEAIDSILSRQAYRLSYWRTAGDEINYRRFFDITGLAALQMQRQEVFDAVHEYTFKLIADGSIAGLRVDHPDGLLDPKEYFDRLQAKYAGQGGAGNPLFVSVEKILNGDESLCRDWPVAGTSGYDFICRVNELFVHSENELAMTGVYERFTGDHTPYAEWVYQMKHLLLDTSFNNDLTSLANRLDALAQCETSSRDFTRRQLRDALREVVACFPVYRSYVSSRGASEADVSVVSQAVDAAILRNPRMDASALEFLRESVLLRYPVAPHVRAKQLEFAQKFQQLTSPVNAKGIEDTTFYIFNRLTSLNEVGGDPGRFGRDPAQLHAYFQDRQQHWPLALSALTTHDTKRSEDVRARLNVLSEIPAEWEKHLATWKTINLQRCASVHPGDQYLLYQTLLGAWPLTPMNEIQRASFTDRITRYMQKAMREAKQRTSWIAVNEPYEAAVAQLVAELIDPQQSEGFLADFMPFQQRVSRLGLLNSLSQTILRLTAPGISDSYQGSELWDFSLVDPDNRRPVDYQHRRLLLEKLNHDAERDLPALIRDLTSNSDDGRIKLWVISQLLQFRRQQSDLFLRGSYQTIPVIGDFAAQLFAFGRLFDGHAAIVVAPRLVASLPSVQESGPFDWKETRLVIPQGPCRSGVRNILSGSYFSPSDEGVISVAEILADFPVAVLVPI